MPWEETDEYIRSGHRSSDDFEKDSLRTITISEEEGIKAVVGKPKGKDTTEIQSYLFAKDKGWTLDKAKAWFEEHKPVKEHVHAVLPFQVIEKVVDKPLRIRGVAMTAGMSRNFNIYTPEELQAFASKLVNAPVYVEHVSVDRAVGKTTKTEWDGQALWYEAEIYESEIADKIRKGLVQHVSVGADYESIDIVDCKIPHGLHNAELSLVAVPGIPETNIQVLERLRESFKSPVKERLKEQGDVACVFCGLPADFLISVCQSCLDKFPAGTSPSEGAPSGVESLNEKELEELVEKKVNEALKAREQATPKTDEERAKAHFNLTDEQWDALSEEEKQDYISKLPPTGAGRQNTVAEAEWDTEYINNLPDEAFAYIEPGGEKDERGKTTPRSLRHLPFKNAQGNLDHDHVVAALQRLDQTEISAEAKAEAKKKLCAAAKELGIASDVCGLTDQSEALRAELVETKDKLEKTEGKLSDAEKTVEELRKQVPGGGLLKDPPEMMPVTEAVAVLEGLLPSAMVENSSMGMKIECQGIRRAILNLKERMKVA